MNIEIKITIKDVQDWAGVNWNDNSDRIANLEKFKREVKDAIEEHAGVYHKDIEIEKIELIK